MATYEFLRLSLRNWDLPPLLEAMGTKKQDRHTYLQDVLSKEIKFMHRSQPYTYVPFEKQDEFLVGAIGRIVTEIKSKGPEHKFAPRERQDWEHANMFISLSSGNEDQLCAIQKHPRVGSPRNIIESLFSHIETTERPYRAAVEYVVNREEFWSAVQMHKGEITEALFTFVPPNMFGGRDEFNKTLRELRDNNAAETTTISLKNSDGNLNLEKGTGVAEMVDCALDGGGETKLKSGAKTIFSSSQGRKTAKIDGDTHVAHAEKSAIKQLIEKLFKQ